MLDLLGAESPSGCIGTVGQPVYDFGYEHNYLSCGVRFRMSSLTKPTEVLLRTHLPDTGNGIFQRAPDRQADGAVAGGAGRIVVLSAATRHPARKNGRKAAAICLTNPSKGVSAM